MPYNHTQARHPAGAPKSIGGQYAPDNRRGGAAVAERPNPVRLSQDDKMQLLRLQGIIKNQVNRQFQGGLVDHEEVFAETMEVAAKNLASGKWSDIRSNIGYLRSSAANKAIDKAYPGQSSDTRMGILELRKRQEKLEQRLGRGLYQKEIDDLADEVRMEQPPGRRAKVGFQHMRAGEGTIALDNPGGEDGEFSLGDVIPAEEQESMTVWDRAADALVDRPGVESVSPDQIRLRYWTMARQDNPDMPEIRRLQARQADDLNEIVSRRPISEIISDYEENNVYSRSAEVLFAPFGGIAGTTDAEREAVVDALTRNRDRAEQLWRTAVEVASKKPKQ